MIRFNFSRIFKARGIDRPFTYLRQSGFSESFASKVKNNKMRRIDLQTIERLCVSLRCTPNDFMEWTPDSKNDIDYSHPLNAIRKSDTEVNITKTLSSIPLGKLNEIEELINEHLKKI